MDAIIKLIINLFKNKYFWIAIAVLIVIVYINKNGYKVKSLLKPRVLDTTLDSTGAVVLLSADTKKHIEEIGKSIRTDLSGVSGLLTSGHNQSFYDAAINLQDSGLLYLSQWYKKSYGIQLWNDVDGDYFIGSYDNELKDKLTKIGEGKA